MEQTNIATCELCGCPVQRTITGTLADGLARHYATVHPNQAVPA